MRSKICGITTLKDGLYAAENGAWALGFNFYPKSPRYISKLAAKSIVEQLPLSILKVGIFIGETYDAIENSCVDIGLNLAQIHEIIEMPSAFKKQVILCLRASSSKDLPPAEILQSYGYILLDAPPNQDGLMGGTGRLSNWDLAHQLAKKYRLILAGGLNGHNVKTAINKVRPYAVDVATGVESTPGIKDKKLVKQFITKVSTIGRAGMPAHQVRVS